MRVYHGSGKIIQKPDFMYKNPDNDYGSGFYTTEDIEMAKLWAVEHGENTAVVSAYDINTSGLNVLYLDTFGSLVWAAEVIYNRGVNGKYLQRIADDFVAKYKMDTDNYDIIIGYRADDGYIEIEEAFLNRLFSVQEMDELYRKGELGQQIFIKSEKAFERLRFSESIKVEGGKYDADYEKKVTEKVKTIIEERAYLVNAKGYQPEGLMITDALAKEYAYHSTSGTYIETSREFEHYRDGKDETL